jgi:hypothetical protein
MRTLVAISQAEAALTRTSLFLFLFAMSLRAEAGKEEFSASQKFPTARFIVSGSTPPENEVGDRLSIFRDANLKRNENPPHYIRVSQEGLSRFCSY